PANGGGDSGKEGAGGKGGGAVRDATVPDIGDFDGVPVIEVLVAAGDTVEKDQGLVTLESDKATMEVPAPFAGVVEEVTVKVGDEVSEGSVVARIATSDGGGAGEATAAPKAGERAQPEGQAPADEQDDPVVEPASPGSRPDNIAKAAMDHAPAGGGAPPVRFEAAAVLPDKVPYASPAVRLFARELGVDLFQVTGSARGGRITREDVQKFVKSALAGGAGRGAAAGGGAGLELLPWPKVDFSKFGEVEEQPLSRIKKISGANLARNWAMIPHVTQHDDADITSLEALRKQLNRENEKAGIKLTMLAFLMKASAAALKEFPEFNSSLDAAGETLTLKKFFHIGFAADTPNGLVVPVVRDCDQKGVIQIAQETAELAKKARDGKLGPAD